MMAVGRLPTYKMVEVGGQGIVPFAGSLLARAIAVLRNKGGSFWVSNDVNTFVNSDGTGVAGDGSDAEYVWDLCGSYATVAVPPTSGTSGWASLSSVLAVQGDALVITNSVGGTEGSGYASFAVKPNTPYAIALEVVAASSGGAVTIGNIRVGLGGVGVKELILTTRTNGLFSLGVNSGVAGHLLSVRNVTVREIIGRPLFQATTGFKPKLRRVPKRLGAELVLSQGQVSPTLAAFATAGSTNFSSPLATGKPYVISFKINSVTSGGVRYQLFGGSVVAGTTFTSAQTTNEIVTASASHAGIQYQAGAANFTGSVEGISVREVIEWTWAWVFDGTDDRLATASLPTADAETIIVAGQFLNTTAAVQGLVSKGNSNFGLMIRRENSLVTTGYGMTGTTTESAALDSSANATTKRVYSVSAASGNKRYRRDGAQVNSTSGTYASNASILSIGAEISSAPAACNVFAVAYCPTALSDAEMLIIERAQAEIAGINF